MRLAVRGVPKGAHRTHSSKQAPLWVGLVICRVLFARAPVLGLCFLVSVNRKGFGVKRTFRGVTCAFQVAHCKTTSLITWLVHPFKLVKMHRLVTRHVPHVTSRVTRLVTRSLA